MGDIFYKKRLVMVLVVLLIGASIIPNVLAIEQWNQPITININEEPDWIVDDEDEGDYKDIQEAIDDTDNVKDGDEIWVFSGNYSRVSISNRNGLKLIGKSLSIF